MQDRSEMNYAMTKETQEGGKQSLISGSKYYVRFL